MMAATRETLRSWFYRPWFLATIAAVLSASLLIAGPHLGNCGLPSRPAARTPDDRPFRDTGAALISLTAAIIRVCHERCVRNKQ